MNPWVAWALILTVSLLLASVLSWAAIIPAGIFAGIVYRRTTDYNPDDPDTFSTLAALLRKE